MRRSYIQKSERVPMAILVIAVWAAVGLCAGGPMWGALVLPLPFIIGSWVTAR